MIEARRCRDSTRLATHAYAPRPVRSFAVRVGSWAAAFAACIGASAAVATWHARQEAAVTAPCVQPPSDDLLQAELARTRLALAQEEAARAALQKTADDATAEVGRLDTELRFLRGQRTKRP